MKPERVIRIGPISGSVFVNEIETEGGTRSIRAVKFERRYKDSEGEWKSTSTFTLADLPVAIAVLSRALQYVADKEADRDIACDNSIEESS